MPQQQMTTERNALGMSLFAGVASQPQTCHRRHCASTYNIQGGNP
jgi:hypothetical protein